MNNEGIQKFKAAAQIGDTVTICTTEGKQSYRYHGKILSFHENHVIIDDERWLFNVPTAVAYRHFYWHSLETKQLQKCC
ncbi:hypothetical protein BC01_046 [Bacillus phage BC01]|nr:hypothetical protein PBC6_040 [Bacillus phage PBC6]AXU41143.1 hypothetical protein BC01_046 [Bacillus phage BC01]